MISTDTSDLKDQYTNKLIWIFKNEISVVFTDIVFFYVLKTF